VAAKVLTLSYKTYSVIFVLIHFLVLVFQLFITFSFVLVLPFFILVLIFVNELIFSFYTIFVFVKKNHTDHDCNLSHVACSRMRHCTFHQLFQHS